VAKLIQIEPASGVQRWALAFVGGKDTGDVPKSCFNCPFLYINQKRCQIHGPDIVIDRAMKGKQVYTPVCCYQRGGTPLAVGDDKVVYNVNTLGDKAADQTGLEWAKSPTGTNCGGFKQGASCEHFVPTEGHDGLCNLMSKEQDETSDAMSEHKGQSVDWDDCCDGHEGENISWREAQKLLKLRGFMKKHHKFSHSITEHHDDGSHTVHHIHEKHGFQGPAKREGDVKGTAGDHDAMMDHMMDHTSQPNPGEANDAANQPMPGAGAPPPGAAGAPPAV
jgi:hypothetical protein